MRKTAGILLVEDDEIDVMSFERHARKAGLRAPITVARSGTEALTILRSAVLHEEGVVPPYVIVTDLNMPGLSGHELIETIRREQPLRRSTVFVVTSSNLSSDVARAYDNNVAGYVVKDSAGSRIGAVVEMLKHYLCCVRAPSE